MYTYIYIYVFIYLFVYSFICLFTHAVLAGLMTDSRPLWEPGSEAQFADGARSGVHSPGSEMNEI